METTLFDYLDENDGTALPGPQSALTVSEICARLKKSINDEFSSVTVIGEISSVTRSKPGHCYLTLKDENSQLGAVIWRSALPRVKFEIQNGLKVICRGCVDYYAAGGKIQLIISEIEPQGMGTLELAFRQLQDKLSREGLFDPRRKKPIPKRLCRIAVITSATGAAIRDFFNILRRRSRRIDVSIYPVLVQGDTASREISDAFSVLNRLPADHPYSPDVIVLIRGGGSMEDLWAFNEERTARAIAASRIPVVTGIGHEIDVTISDMAADLRCLTPSDAAVRLIPDDTEIPLSLSNLEARLSRSIRRKLSELDNHLLRVARSQLFENPADRILGTKRMITDQIEIHLDRTADAFLLRCKNDIAKAAAQLESLSPLGVLARGYSITTTEDGKPLLNAAALQPGDHIQTRLESGEVQSKVTQVIPALPE